MLLAVDDCTTPKVPLNIEGATKLADAINGQMLWNPWRYGERDGRATKLAFTMSADGGERLARSSVPAEWTSFEVALERYRNGGYSGLGMLASSPFVAIDLDHCLDPSTGAYTEKAQVIMDKFKGAYIEQSPGGEGLRIIVFAPGFKFDKDKWKERNNGIEVYAGGSTHWISITGATIQDSPLIADCTEIVKAFMNEYMKRTPKTTPQGHEMQPVSLNLSNSEIVEKARTAKNCDTFCALYDRGDISGYPSQSEADSALCTILAFWTGGDATRIEEIFNASALNRGKWSEREDYRHSTIQKAVSVCTTFYDPQKGRAVNRPFCGGSISDSPSRRYPKLYSGEEMDTAVFEPVVWAVDTILPREGLAMIYAGAKCRKSWLALDMACAIAEGGQVLNFQATQSDVLYFSLEMGKEIVQERVRQLQARNGNHFPHSLMTTYEANNVDNGFFDELNNILTDFPSIKVVFVDMWVHIRGDARHGETSYKYDYRELTEIKNFAISHGILIVLMHHTRKAFDSDSLGKLNGSNGIAGAVDTFIYIELKGRKDNTHGTIEVNGKRIREAKSYRIHVDPLTAELVNEGAEDDLEDGETDTGTAELLMLVQVLSDGGGGTGWRGYAKNLLDIYADTYGHKLSIDGKLVDTGQKFTKVMEQLKRDGAFKALGVIVSIENRTGSGKVYSLRRDKETMRSMKHDEPEDGESEML